MTIGGNSTLGDSDLRFCPDLRHFTSARSAHDRPRGPNPSVGVKGHAVCRSTLTLYSTEEKIRKYKKKNSFLVFKHSCVSANSPTSMQNKSQTINKGLIPSHRSSLSPLTQRAVRGPKGHQTRLLRKLTWTSDHGPGLRTINRSEGG